MTSADLVRIVKRASDRKKLGHTGTLDKFAEGLLILPFGAYTTFSSFFLTEKKQYLAKLSFGKFTDSGDRDGEVLNSMEEESLREKLQDLEIRIQKDIEHLVERKEQVPPKVSALKVKGKRQAELFRKGIQFTVKSRPIQVYNSEFLGFEDLSCSFRLEVSAGTYIRKIAMDLSEEWGIPAHLAGLKRERIGDIDSRDANSLEDAEKGSLRVFSIKELLKIPVLQIGKNQEKFVRNGVFLNLENLPGGEFILESDSGKICALCSTKEKKLNYAYRYLRVFA
ncbi:MAG: tRNA pseudouridine(55) synthase TruB [Leptospiraceae bacterium]|nr:tRNA pseudouridine(55) synthase TruB [Leptospiraceae bacterium]MCP5502835.1 tRNA pseudouridine(55) synthase TruB [Leptospiraceae bacterium]